MTRWQLIQQKRVAERRKALDSLMADVRKVAEQHAAVVFPFGSYAAGQTHAGSDLDVAFPGDLSAETRRGLIRSIERLQECFGIEIDMVFEAESPHFFREVCDEHRVH